jgi:hypothetical protein
MSRKDALIRMRNGKDSHFRGLGHSLVINGNFRYAVLCLLLKTTVRSPRTGRGGASFANDPRDPTLYNAEFVVDELQDVSGLVLREGADTLTRVFLKAIKYISAGSEIFVNYGTRYWVKYKVDI